MSPLSHHQLDSQYLKRKRKVRVYLPDSNSANPDRLFPLIIQHDGQLAFSERDEELPYGSWQMDLRLERLVREDGLEPAVIVGIDNSAARRKEYFPLTSEFEAYQNFLLEELLPWARDKFPLVQSPDLTYTMGSSMGGLVSFALAANHPEVFSAAGCISPWFEYEDNAYIRQVLRKMQEKPAIRVWLDSGIQDWRMLDDGHRATLLARKELERLGFELGSDMEWSRDLFFPEDSDFEGTPVNPENRDHCKVNQHTEFHFGRRSEAVLRWLLS